MQKLVFDLKKYVLSQETNGSLSLFTWKVVDIFLWRFFHYVLIPRNSWLKKQGGILTFNDMFQTFWHLLSTIAQIASADAEIFHWAVFSPQSFCHVSPQIKAAVHSRTNCVGIVDKDSAGVKCYQVRPSVPQPYKIQSVDLIHAEEMALFMQPFQC